MIYLFTGENDYLLKEEVNKWKDKFINKFGDFNLVHIKNYDNIDINFISENLLGTSFLATSKLIILDDIPLATNLKTKRNYSDILKIEEYILTILDKIPDGNIVLFSSSSVDKRSKIYKKIKELGKINEFNKLDLGDIPKIINNKYGDIITRDGINELIKYKGGNLVKITSEIDKLLLTIDKIKAEDIKKNIIPELEESIFIIIDLIIIGVNKNKILDAVNVLLNEINIYAFYNTLVSNLRFYVYIGKLKSLKYVSRDITKMLNLGNRAWLVDKKKFDYSRIKKIYLSLIDLDKKNKTGELLGTTDKDFKFEIEKIILSN